MIRTRDQGVRFRGGLSAVLAGVLMVGGLAQSVLAQEAYRQPPADVVKILEAPSLPGVSLSPDRAVMVLMERETLPPIADMAAPMLRLAGYRVNPDTNAPHGPRTVVGLTLKQVSGGRETKVQLPADANIGGVRWSPDSKRFAFTITKENGVEVWVCDASSGKARSLSGATLNALGSDTVQWMPDSKTLLCQFVPAGRGSAPVAPRVPKGPVVQETSGKVAPVRTYQDLLANPHDEALFDHYFVSQLAFLDADTGKRTDLGAPGVYSSVNPSPSGEFLLVERVERPYSYIVPAYLFGTTSEVWDRAGKNLATVWKHGLLEEIPIEGVPTGRRSIQWSSTEAARLFWAEALDGGDPKTKVPHRDKLMTLGAPFTGEPKEVLKTEHRFSGLTWIDAPDLALVTEYDRDKRWVRSWMVKPIAGGEPRLVWDRSIRDRYKDPGRPLTTLNAFGRSVVRVEGGWAYLSGSGASPEGDRPFLDRMDLESLAVERLWRCEGETYESIVDVLEAAGPRFMTSYETRNDPPNYFMRDLASNARNQITNFPDPAPQLRGITKELVKYQRADGVELSATLYLPAGYDKTSDGPLPLVVWAYPMEYNDPATAGQVSGSPYRFTRIGGTSHLFYLTQGYAIMDDAAMPVVGEPETMNDTFVEQIVGAAKAAIDKAAEMGVGDPDRVGVGGHSYGAFMTANLLAHCDLFRAGVARSGAYNRTLTPFGFQSERRTFWEATQIYMNLSPFTHANKINEPLLLIHGEVDNNSGTFPIQSERLYAAVKGHGGTTRLVMLPHESHGYRAKESVMHTLAEMIDWFDLHVKHKGSPGAAN